MCVCQLCVCDCMYPSSCPPCSVAAGLLCAHYGVIKPMTIDTLHDCSCRAAVIGTDKVKCGTPSFEESRVCVSPALTMTPTQSDICWYNTVAMLPGKYREIAARWRINLHSPRNEADVFTSQGAEEEVWSVLGEKTCLPVVGDRGSIFHQRS